MNLMISSINVVERKEIIQEIDDGGQNLNGMGRIGFLPIPT